MIKKLLQKIFKKISYFFFSTIYGKIDSSIKSNEDKRIEVKFFEISENLKYRIYKISSGRLYTDRIHDTAAILDNKIIDGASFQLRNNNYSEISKNSVFEKGTPRILKKINGTVLSLLTGGGGNDNYWHWLYDVLPRIKLSEKFKSIDQIDFFLLPSIKKKFQKQTLQELNIDNKKILSSEDYRHIKANELIVTDHPYILSDNSHTDAQKIPEWIIEWLKKIFLTNSNNKKNNYPKKIFIDRSDSKASLSQFRLLVNEDEVKSYLEKKDFTSVKLNDLDFLEQVHLFNNADCIVGLHGAGFANLAFCKKNTKVIEFRMSKTGKVIENLALKNKLRFDSVISEPESHNIDKHMGHIKISLNVLEKKISDI